MKNLREKQGKNRDTQMLSWAARMLYIGALVALIVLIGIQQSCNSSKPFSGTYINSAGSEFSLANDTLVLEQVEGNQYRIHRMTGYRLISDSGRLGSYRWEKEEWFAVYDPEREIMSEKRHGKQISFTADCSVMTVGRRAYQKIN
ncbi:hypothetical protein ASU31_10565 [Pedobacter ginsenosidimutans]|uniref:Uncharacterized protein n=2 Tax=Pedobacter ginsenosidimutans TaxID=687842 RepID=A0A0T5VQ58_9SPHI|nr:hypothetical protein ASU31_10565 [Pedobacter ginsenosidimutans]